MFVSVRVELKKRAVELRIKGYTYQEILSQVPVTKSTLSLWLRSVVLSQDKKQSIVQKRLLGAQRGANIRKERRIQDTEKIARAAAEQVGSMTAHEKFLVGVALYWAEGSKQRNNSISSGVIFSNSDPGMIRFFMDWLLGIDGVEQQRLVFELYVHTSQQERIAEMVRYWVKVLRVPARNVSVYLKKGKASTNRKNTKNEYYGQIRIKVRSSAVLNRMIAGWAMGIVNNCGIV